MQAGFLLAELGDRPEAFATAVDPTARDHQAVGPMAFVPTVRVRWEEAPKAYRSVDDLVETARPPKPKPTT